MQEWFSFYWFRADTLRSFSWENPYCLFLLAGVPTLYLLKWIFRSQNREKLAITIDVSMAGRFSDFVAYLRYIPPFLMGLSLACFVLALARPQRILASQEQFSDGIDIMMALDISESMKGKDLIPDRLTAAKAVAKTFINGRFQDRIGLVCFTGEAYLLSPPTTDYSILTDILDEVNENTIPASGTAVGDALAKCVNRLRDVEVDSKIIILISDGASTVGRLAASTVAKLALNFNIKIYSIAVGSLIGQPDAEKVDESTLKEIARVSNGRYFHVADNQSLKLVFQQINSLEKVKIKAQNYRDTRDYYYIYIYWGILFFLTVLLLKSTFIGNILED